MKTGVTLFWTGVVVAFIGYLPEIMPGTVMDIHAKLGVHGIRLVAFAALAMTLGAYIFGKERICERFAKEVNEKDIKKFRYVQSEIHLRVVHRDGIRGEMELVPGGTITVANEEPPEPPETE